MQSLTIEPHQTTPPEPRFTWSMLTPIGSFMDFVKLRVTNVSGVETKGADLVVLDEPSETAIAYKQVQSIDSGTFAEVEFYSASGRSYAVYVNGIRAEQALRAMRQRRILRQKQQVGDASSREECVTSTVPAWETWVPPHA